VAPRRDRAWPRAAIGLGSAPRSGSGPRRVLDDHLAPIVRGAENRNQRPVNGGDRAAMGWGDPSRALLAARRLEPV